MFGGFWRKSHGLIGVDMGTRWIRMVQLAQRGSEYRVHAAQARMLADASKPLEGDAYHQAAKQAIVDMLNVGGFAGRTAVTILPTAQVQHQNLRLPAMPANERDAAVKWEAAGRLHFDGAPAEIQYFDAGEIKQGDERRQEVILMAAPTDVVEAHVNTLVDAGLRLQAIDVSAGALARFACALDSQADAIGDPVHMIVDVGYLASKVVIASAGRVLFFKVIEVGGQHLDQAVAQRLNLSIEQAAQLRRSADPAEHGLENDKLFGVEQSGQVGQAIQDAVRPMVSQLAKELSLCLRYYSVTFRGDRPEAVQLVGGEALQQDLAAQIQEGVGLPVQLAGTSSLFSGSSLPNVMTADGNVEAWATAIGLALREKSSSAGGRAA